MYLLVWTDSWPVGAVSNSKTDSRSPAPQSRKILGRRNICFREQLFWKNSLFDTPSCESHLWERLHTRPRVRNSCCLELRFPTRINCWLLDGILIIYGFVEIQLLASIGYDLIYQSWSPWSFQPLAAESRPPPMWDTWALLSHCYNFVWDVFVYRFLLPDR